MVGRCYGGQLIPVGRDGAGGPNNIPVPVGGIEGFHGESCMGRVVVVVVGGDSKLLQQGDGGESWVPRR
jgi:hypothetical protein